MQAIALVYAGPSGSSIAALEDYIGIRFRAITVKKFQHLVPVISKFQQDSYTTLIDFRLWESVISV